MAEILTLAGFISLLSLTLMEIVLGVDNVIFISILTGRLPEKDQKTARPPHLHLHLPYRHHSYRIRHGIMIPIHCII